MERPPLGLRQATPDDLRFVKSSWYESYRKGGCAPAVRYEEYKAGQGKLIDLLTDRDAVTVAYATAVPDEICGWVCAGWDCFHYVYVKQAYRRMGIASELCRLYLANSNLASHETRTGRRFAAKLGIRFNPYLLYHLNP